MEGAISQKRVANTVIRDWSVFVTLSFCRDWGGYVYTTTPSVVFS